MVYNKEDKFQTNFTLGLPHKSRKKIPQDFDNLFQKNILENESVLDSL